MASPSFDSLEKQFSKAYADVSSKAELAGSISGAKLKTLAAEVQDGLAKAESLIRSMDLEARTGEPSQRPALLARLREHKIRLLALKKSARQLAGLAAGSSARGAGADQPLGSVLDAEGLASESTAGGEDLAAAQRDRLLSTNARLDASTTRIGDARRMALQSEQLGVSILMDLHDQRQSLLHAHDTLHETDDEISRARHVLRVMVAKMNRNKWSIGLIIFLLFLAIALVIYLRLQR